MAVIVAIGVGLAFGVGLGVGLGANFALVGALGATHALNAGGAGGVMSPRERFRLCSLTEAEAEPVPTPAELEAMLARWRARAAEPKWGVP